MIRAVENLQQTGSWQKLSNDECLGIIVDQELTDRLNKRTAVRLKKAKLRSPGIIEDIDWSNPRGLDRAFVSSLASCDWIANKQNLILNGPTGTGKTWLACAFADKACREGFSTKFIRFPRLLEELSQARLDGSISKYVKDLEKTDLLILDDWGQSLNERDRRELLEIIEDRNEKSSLIITSQLPVNHWHEAIGDPTIADAILDRIIHRAHKIILTGKSLRGNMANASIESDSKEKKSLAVGKAKR